MSESQSDLKRLAEAGAWLSQLAQAGVDSSPGFEIWLASDPANRVAWNDVRKPWDAFGDAASSPAVMAARREALHRAQSHRSKRGIAAVPRKAMAGIAVGALLAAAASFVAFDTFSWDTYRTSLGERKTVTLADNSHIVLDADSQVRVRYTHAQRRLELINGQARFDVAHDPGRPFSVVAGEETVVATGTAFNVNFVGQRVLVTLIKGRVTVFSDQGKSQGWPLIGTGQRRSDALTAGQQLAVGPAHDPVVGPAHIDQVQAWEAGQLIFDNETLATTARQVSRYTGHPIDVDPGIADLRISGVFDEGDSAGFLNAVTEYLGVHAENRPDGGIILKKGK